MIISPISISVFLFYFRSTVCQMIFFFFSFCTYTLGGYRSEYSYYFYITQFAFLLILNLIEQQYEDFEIQSFLIQQLIISNFISFLTLINFGDDHFTILLFFSVPFVIKIVSIAQYYPIEKLQSIYLKTSISQKKYNYLIQILKKLAHDITNYKQNPVFRLNYINFVLLHLSQCSNASCICHELKNQIILLQDQIQFYNDDTQTKLLSGSYNFKHVNFNSSIQSAKYYKQKIRQVSKELLFQVLDEQCQQNDNLSLLIAHATYLFSVQKNIPKTIVTLQTINLKIEDKMGTISLRDKYLTLQITSICYKKIKASQFAFNKIDYSIHIQLDRLLTDIYKQIWLLVRMKQEFFQFLKHRVQKQYIVLDASMMILREIEKLKWNLDLAERQKITSMHVFQSRILYSVIIQDYYQLKAFRQKVKMQQQKQNLGSIEMNELMNEDIFSSSGLVTLSLLNLGRVTRYSSSFLSLVKGNIHDSGCLIGDNINTFIPSQIHVSHDDMIRRYIERGSCVLIRTGDLLFPYLTKQGFIIKVNIQFTLNTWIYEDFLVDACVFSKPLNQGFMVTDLQGFIDNSSQLFYYFLLSKNEQCNESFNMANLFQNLCMYFPSLLHIFYMGGIYDLVKEGSVTKTLFFFKPSPEHLSKPRRQPGGTASTASTYLQYFNRYCTAQTRLWKQSALNSHSFNYKIIPLVKRFYKYELMLEKTQVYQVELKLTVFSFNQATQDILLVDIYSMKQVQSKRTVLDLIIDELEEMELTTENQLTSYFSQSSKYYPKKDSDVDMIREEDEEEKLEESQIMENLMDDNSSLEVQILQENLSRKQNFIELKCYQGPKYDESYRSQHIYTSIISPNCVKSVNTSQVKQNLISQKTQKQEDENKINMEFSSELDQEKHEVVVQQDPVLIEEDQSSVSSITNKGTVTMSVKNAYLRKDRLSQSRILLLSSFYFVIVLVALIYDLYFAQDSAKMMDFLSNVKALRDISKYITEMSVSANFQKLIIQNPDSSNDQFHFILDYFLNDSFVDYNQFFKKDWVLQPTKYQISIEKALTTRVQLNVSENLLNTTLYDYLLSNYPSFIAQRQNDFLINNSPSIVQLLFELVKSLKSLLYQYVDSNIKNKIIEFTVIQIVLVILLSALLKYCIDKIKQINTLLGSYQKFSNKDIDDWIEGIEYKQIARSIQNQNAYTMSNKDQTLLLQKLKDKLNAKITSYKKTVNLYLYYSFSNT